MVEDLFQGRGRRDSRSGRLLRHRRRRDHRPQRLHADHRSRQGRHQVGRRVDFVDRHRKSRGRPPRRPGSGGDRRHPSQMGRAPAADRRAEGRQDAATEDVLAFLQSRRSPNGGCPTTCRSSRRSPIPRPARSTSSSFAKRSRTTSCRRASGLAGAPPLGAPPGSPGASPWPGRRPESCRRGHRFRPDGRRDSQAAALSSNEADRAVAPNLRPASHVLHAPAEFT